MSVNMRPEWYAIVTALPSTSMQANRWLLWPPMTTSTASSRPTTMSYKGPDSVPQPSPSREPHHTSSLSLFPLGMFEFERGPTRSRTTLFWIITWSSRR